MTVWYHLSTIFNRKNAVQFAVILTLCVGLITTLFFTVTTRAQEGINQTIGFQGRLLDANGNVVPDGSYNMQFKIYEGGSGDIAVDPARQLSWTETYTNGNDTGVEIVNGYLSVSLGSLVPFADSVNWNQDTLWLSMNVAGREATCATFGAGNCLADGEMLPMKRLTTSPYAMNAGQLDGKSSDQFVQLGQGVQTDTGVDTSSIFINKTSSGNLVQLQNNSNNVFTVGNTGNVTFGATGDKTISVADAAANTDGGSITISAGNGGAGEGTNGGNIVLSGGSGSGTGGDGLVVITTPTFSTALNDANCYTGGALVEASCSIAPSSINSSAGIIVGFSEVGQTATLPDPIIKTAGRIVLVMAATDSEPFTLALNGGGAGNEIAMRANTTETIVWNGSNWTASGSATARTVEYSADSLRIQVGDGSDQTDTTVLTLDKGTGAPVVENSEAMLGSMYYDTTLGRIQCYEASGWGNCSDSPDRFVTLSPEYSNSVTNGSGIGSLTSDICSADLGLNDGSNAQPIVCDEYETYNFYNWTSAEATAQTKSVYVNYQLPSNFTGFVADSTSLMGRVTSDLDAGVSYQIYKKTTEGLALCGTTQDVTIQNTWQKVAPSGLADPANCGFVAGDTLMFKIDLTASNNAHAYISTLGFAFSDD